jgi:arsenate reductase
MERQEILFVCIGNACRSQMAEGFARHYGGNLVACSSAGMMPLLSVPALTRRVMLEKNIPIDDQYPKGIELFRRRNFDRIINMSGMAMPSGILGKVEEWVVGDPYGCSDGVYRQVRDHLEGRVMKLLLEMRNCPPAAPAARPARLKLRGV